MASKGQRSKLDHETRNRRQKTLEAPREPRRPKAHWDHVLEEMAWLSKDFESERKWKLAQAKKVALRASKGMLDQATREERKLKEEEQRLRKIALTITKDVKKFWIKVEKLVLYKHQMELDEKKKKTLDKQLELLLGQTERYSTMLAENLVESHKPLQQSTSRRQLSIQNNEAEGNDKDEPLEKHDGPHSDVVEDDDYDVKSEDELEDDERTLEEDEAHISSRERLEELEALRNEVDLPIEELLKRYAAGRGSRETSPEDGKPEATFVGQNNASDKENAFCTANETETNNPIVRRSGESNGGLSIIETHPLTPEVSQSQFLTHISPEPDKKVLLYDFNEEQEDCDFILAAGEDKDDENTLSEEEELAKEDAVNPQDEIALLQKESEMSVEELLARYKKDFNDNEVSDDESENDSALSEDHISSPSNEEVDSKEQIMSLYENLDVSEGKPDVNILGEEQESGSNEKSDEKESEIRIADAAAAARSAQPTGYTFSTTKVRTKLPFLLKHSLREYQHIGLDWLVTMYEKRLNGILADEMGLGKTIMTIALLAHLACEKGIWGPHLIVVPTSVMLNWETEFLKWCPAFKILTYFGSAKERKLKRQGWLKPNFFHVCITTYRLVIQDAKIFKRKKWKYLILDEAHLIKNWKSQRWQTLLNFNSKRRILLTGTPLQNDLMELWSLMHFLMPHVFQSHQEFKDWFSNPISGMVDGQDKVNKEVIDRLHNVLRPFLLRRLKRDVEKQLPMKREHVIYCRLSKRQRNLYEDFIASSETQATLASSNFFGMISVIMQLRKVCNHPDLFEGRPIVSSFDMDGLDIQLSSSVCSILSSDPFSTVDVVGLGLLFTHLDFSMTSWESDEVIAIATPSRLIEERVGLNSTVEIPFSMNRQKLHTTNIFEDIQKAILEEQLKEAKERASSIAWWNSLRCRKKPMYSTSLRNLLTVKRPVDDILFQKIDKSSYSYSSKLADLVHSPVHRFKRMIDLVESFMFAIPAARAPTPVCWSSKSSPSVFLHPTYRAKCSESLLPLLSTIRPAIVRRQVYFPDRRLIQFDCGKLQELAILLRKLKSEGHRALIFTQMTKMLDILEAFINLYGYTYMRLDGSTQPEERQTLMQRFNTNPKFFLFILSTRSGGVGINLVGADTVIFYDSDWNPAMDQQAQDRCHRIGQTREVHIYRLISDSTIEENILKKANQKRALDDLVIQSGGYNTEFLKKLDPIELFSGHRDLPMKHVQKEKSNTSGTEVSLSNADVEAALKHAEDEADYMALKKVEQEEEVDNQEFTEEAIGKLEDDEFANEDDGKVEEQSDQVGWLTVSNKDNSLIVNGNDSIEERGRTLGGNDEDIDMIDDVKQMAAAAAATGQGISSFENQLRPIDRYAIRFLEMWDPIIDKAAVEAEVSVEEKEWDIDHIERYKEEMEAEIDDDEEPLVYENWDADFATEAYRQQVEALAQHQLMEELECEAKEKEDAEDVNSHSVKNEIGEVSKPKSKKKTKKAKFKSLKKGSLTSEQKHVKEGSKIEPMSIDDDAIYYDEIDGLDTASQPSSVQKKRKKVELRDVAEEKSSKKKSKKLKKARSDICPLDMDTNQLGKRTDDSKEPKPSDSMVVDLEQKSAGRSKTGGKISITAMPVKRVLMIKSEKLKKENVWSRECVTSPDFWLPQEDAILCAVVHEYGPHWILVSETLYGMTAGGNYRGRYRHPVHCCERYRELIQRYIFSTPDITVNEKIGSAGSGKALLKVTEDNIRTLLTVVVEQPDTELLLQRHFTALLSSVWRVTSRTERRRNLSTCNGLSFGGRIFGSSVNKTSQNLVRETAQRMQFTSLSGKLIAAALNDATNNQQDNGTPFTYQREDMPDNAEHMPGNAEHMDVTLEFKKEKDDPVVSWPPIMKLTIHGPTPLMPVNNIVGEDNLKSSQSVAENRFRASVRACDEGRSLGWASSTFPANDLKSRSTTRFQSSGKHKLSASDSVRPSKSKSRKTSSEHEFAEQQFPPMGTTQPYDLNTRFDLALPINDENLVDKLDDIYSCGLGEESSLMEMDLHDYDPNIYWGLEDCSILPEYTDIG